MKGKYITTQILLACKAKPVLQDNLKQMVITGELQKFAARKIVRRKLELVAA